MSLVRVAAADWAAGRVAADTVIDVRSPAEFALDHLPGAVNWPVLDDAERALVGTEHARLSAFDARKRGAALAAANIARHLAARLDDKPRGWRPLVYCWRGGQRSGSLGLVLSEIGYAVQLLDGGYRAFRGAVREALERLPAGLRFSVLCGRTGSAKTRLLQALAARGEQVLDLESLACHRGSVLGTEPGLAQPSQKAFDTAVWDALRRFDPARPVFVESESRSVGRLRVPETLLARLRAAPCTRLELPLAERVRFLLGDYRHFVDDAALFGQRLELLRPWCGAVTVERWQALARQATADDPGPLATVVGELLVQHYDPVYDRSMPRNYAGYAAARVLPLACADGAALAAAAAALAGHGQDATDAPSKGFPAPG